MQATPVNWEDVPKRAVEVGPIAGTWRDLGTPAGTRAVGLRRIQLEPGKRSTPAHTHSGEEEVFVVLEGSGAYLEQAPGAAGWEPEERPVRAGDVVAVLAGSGAAHAFRAGAEGLTYLAYGDRVATDTIWYPQSRKISYPGLKVIGRLELLGYWDGEE